MTIPTTPLWPWILLSDSSTSDCKGIKKKVTINYDYKDRKSSKSESRCQPFWLVLLFFGNVATEQWNARNYGTTLSPLTEYSSMYKKSMRTWIKVSCWPRKCGLPRSKQDVGICYGKLRDIVVECEMLFLTTVDDILLFVEFSDALRKEAMSGCSWWRWIS